MKSRQGFMFLIVGLGNFGTQYLTTRHNVGFMVCDYWLKSLGNSTPNYKEEHKAYTIKFKLSSHLDPQKENKSMKESEILVVKPQTYMNRSGESVVSLLQYYKIDRSKMLVIHDDIDQPFGQMKLQFNRGHAGQNGVRNISELLGTQEYARLKIGVGRPLDPQFAVADYVLGSFSKEESQNLPKILDTACDAVESFIFDGLSIASTKYNKAVKVD